MNYIKENIEIEYKYWEHLRQELYNELQSLPTGTIISKHKNGRTYYYRQFDCTVNGHREKRLKTIRGNSQDTLEGLLRRKYIVKILPYITKNLELMNSFLNSFKDCNPNDIIGQFNTLSYGKLLSKCNIFLPQNLRQEYQCNISETRRWLELPCNNEDFYPEDLKHTTGTGILVRSKSELLIANCLEHRGLAYKYEFPVTINCVQYRPDIIIKLPYTEKFMYWEHFGMINDNNYAKNVSNKLEIYRANGITLWDNLIISFDSVSGTINVNTINNLIDLFVMPHFR